MRANFKTATRHRTFARMTETQHHVGHDSKEGRRRIRSCSGLSSLEIGILEFRGLRETYGRRATQFCAYCTTRVQLYQGSNQMMKTLRIEWREVPDGWVLCGEGGRGDVIEVTAQRSAVVEPRDGLREESQFISSV